MIKNKTIIDKINEKTKDDDIMRQFLFEIINHENENSQYTKKYKEEIDTAMQKKGE